MEGSRGGTIDTTCNIMWQHPQPRIHIITYVGREATGNRYANDFLVGLGGDELSCAIINHHA